MTRDGLVEENLRTGEQTLKRTDKPEHDPVEEANSPRLDGAADNAPVIAEMSGKGPEPEMDFCADADDGGEVLPRRRSTAKQSADYYNAHKENGQTGKPFSEPSAPDNEESQTGDVNAGASTRKKSRLSFEDERSGMVRGAGMGIKRAAKKGVDAAAGYTHKKVHQAEKENSGVESAHKSEEAAERLYGFFNGRKKKKLKERPARSEKKQAERETGSRLKFSEEDADAEDTVQEAPEKKMAASKKAKKKAAQKPIPAAKDGKAAAKDYQKKRYKAAYASAIRGEKAGAAAGKQASAVANTVADKAKAAVQELVVKNKAVLAGVGLAAMLLFLIMGAFSSCSAVFQGGGGTFIGTTYPSRDADMEGAENEYLRLEEELQRQIDRIESSYPGYDEYRYQLDEISHDPYQLISHLTAVYEQFTVGQVMSPIQALFQEQYVLKVWETIEIRTRMETRTGYTTSIDPFTGGITVDSYQYEVEVEYEYKILNVWLKNNGFDTVARNNMDDKQTGRYDAYNLTYGNRPELFGAGTFTYNGTVSAGGGTGGTSGGGGYTVPAEALSDETFARMLEEAEKYLGMPYVWGGSDPSTSFDCSGFVCYVINHCGNGWNVGRTTAEGLRQKCTYVSPDDAQPGDLIFFEKTYNTSGASHVGIYVGGGQMLHCGNPISYTSINSNYWRNHFLAFGRIR